MLPTWRWYQSGSLGSNPYVDATLRDDKINTIQEKYDNKYFGFFYFGNFEIVSDEMWNELHGKLDSSGYKIKENTK